MTPEAWKEILAQSLRWLAPTDVYAYGEYAYGHAPAAHHREMVDWMLERIEQHQNGVVLLPRGHAKTTWGNTIILSWLIAKSPMIRVGLFSNTATQANAFSRAIRFNYEANQFHQEVFGNLTGQAKWRDMEWIQRDSPLHATKDVTMYSQGAGGAVISKRFDLILCDDILDEENTSNIEQQEKVETWFWKTLKPCLAPGGSIIVLGTRWAEGDLYQKLIDPAPDGKGWPSLVKGAWSFEPDDELNEHPIALWPAMWPVEKLITERNDMGGSMFACSYLNDISAMMEGNVFRREWFKYYTSMPDSVTWKMGVDLASSEKERADFTARVIIGVDYKNNVYVESVKRDKMDSGHGQFVIDGANAYPGISRIVIENNQFQSALVQELLKTTSLPVIGKRTDVDKVTRARAVAARYESGKVFHHESLRGSPFEVELLSFPKGHDDMVDALGNAMETGSGGFIFGGLARR
jgi:predicted phage terminase large subunit-like protein